MAFTMGGMSYGPIVWQPPQPVPAGGGGLWYGPIPGPGSGGSGSGAGGAGGSGAGGGGTGGGGGACIVPNAGSGGCASRMSKPLPDPCCLTSTPDISQLQHTIACDPL